MMPQFKKVVKYIFAAIGAVIWVFILYILLGMTLSYLQVGPGKSIHSKRLSDARYIFSILEQYKDEHKVYPTSLDQLVPKYLGSVPVYPKNGKEKICTAEHQQYKYILDSTGDFKLSFCMEMEVQNFKSGINTLTPQGLIN